MFLQNTIYAAVAAVCLCQPILTASLEHGESRGPRMAKLTERRRRAYTPWVESRGYEGIESFAVWKPPMYQLSRPYYIPIYGVSGRVPMFFPPQTLNPQPVVMPDNALNKPPFQGPTYLPPKEFVPPTSTEMPSTVMVFKDRFMGSEDDEDRPVWGEMSQNNDKKVPTRPTRPPGMQSQQFPPLVHAIDQGEGDNLMHLSAPQSQDEIVQSQRPKENQQRPQTNQQRPKENQQRPQPNQQRPQVNQQRPQPNQQRPQGNQQRPQTNQQRPSTQRAPVSTTAAPGPSNCVWAVISCCSTSTITVPENCFEARGCPGPFWDKSPCQSEFANAAVETALKYYSK